MTEHERSEEHERKVTTNPETGETTAEESHTIETEIDDSESEDNNE